MQTDELPDLKPGLEISFSTCKDVQDTLQKYIKRSPHNPWVFIHDISLKDVRHLNDNFQTSSRSDYYIDLQLAIFYLKIPSHDHDWNITHFTRLMGRKLQLANITDSNYTWMLNKTFSGFRREKTPDGAFFPMEFVPRNAWPVLTMEVGVSETLPQLRRDAIWWFRQSLDIKYVLLMSLDISQQTIFIEAWERIRALNPRNTRSGHTTTLDPAPAQTLTISSNSVNGSLSLSIDSLFGRTGSGNITFGQELTQLLPPP